MYSFGPVPRAKKSGKVIGAHQKIDRVARRHLTTYVDRGLPFPNIRDILHFEGYNGPDGVKLKSPGRDEPLHFIDPANPDERIVTYIREHQANLQQALVERDHVRAAFEAAWLAHTVVDGLTPAHHEPFESELERLRGHNELPTSVRGKVIMPGGGSAKQFVKNNWEYWGAGGIMTAHMLFEAGVATTMKPLNFEAARPSRGDTQRVVSEGFEPLFLEALSDIAALDMYTQYKKSGWTRHMAQLTKDVLVPTIIQMVVLSWYAPYAAALKDQP